MSGPGLKAFHGILSPRIPPPSLDQTAPPPRSQAGRVAVSQPDSRAAFPLGVPLPAPPAPSGGRNAGKPDAEREDGRVDRTLGPPAPLSEWPKGPAARRKGGVALVRWGRGRSCQETPGGWLRAKTGEIRGKARFPGPNVF